MEKIAQEAQEAEALRVKYEIACQKHCMQEAGCAWKAGCVCV